MSSIIIQDINYGNKLLDEIWEKRKTLPEHTDFINLTIKLLRFGLTDKSNRHQDYFDQEELLLLKEYTYEPLTTNKEIITRWLDALLSLDRSLKAKYIRLVSLNYRSLYNTTGEFSFLMRHLTLVKYAKQLFKEDLEDIFQQAIPSILSLSPYWQREAIKELLGIYNEQACQKSLAETLISQIDQHISRLNFNEARYVIESLGDMKYLSMDDIRIKLAESYEAEADHMSQNKAANTYYPRISTTYNEALDQISNIRDCELMKSRIIQKLSIAQQEDVKMLRAIGNSFKEEERMTFQDMVEKIKIDSFESGFQWLLTFPIFPEELFSSANSKSHSFLSSFFPEYVKISSKGTRIGKTDAGTGKEILSHELYLKNAIHFISHIKMQMDDFQKTTITYVYNRFEKSKSEFIPPDRLLFYSQGVHAGFENDFVTSAHLLMPQLENSLRYIAEQNGIVMTDYTKECQLENTLGGCLHKMKEIISPDLKKELEYFLVKTSGVNFRNQIAHGLISHEQVHYYGIFLWWLVLKLTFQTKDFFKLI